MAEWTVAPKQQTIWRHANFQLTFFWIDDPYMAYVVMAVVLHVTGLSNFEQKAEDSK